MNLKGLQLEDEIAKQAVFCIACVQSRYSLPSMQLQALFLGPTEHVKSVKLYQMLVMMSSRMHAFSSCPDPPLTVPIQPN